MFTRIKNLIFHVAAGGVFFIAPWAVAQDTASSVNDLIQGATQEKYTSRSPVAQSVLGAIERTAGSSDTINHGQRAQAIQEALEPFKIAKDALKDQKDGDKNIEKAMANAIEKSLREGNTLNIASFRDDGKKEIAFAENDKLTKEIIDVKGLTAGLSKNQFEKLGKIERKDGKGIGKGESMKEEKAVVKDEKVAEVKEDKKEEPAKTEPAVQPSEPAPPKEDKGGKGK